MWDSGGHQPWSHQGAGDGGFSNNSTLYMGNLEPYMDEGWIKSLWYSMGENVNVKMIRDKFTGGNAGYCFVDFGNTQSAAKMLQSLNGTLIPQTNKVFKLNWASGGGVAAASVHDRGPEFSVFVGDLGPEVTDMMLLQTFQSRYASCKSAKVVTDPMTGHTRGYGFVRFSDENDQARALTEMTGIYCGSRPMRVSVATPKAGGQQQQSGSTGGRGVGTMGGMGGAAAGGGGGAGGMTYGAPMQSGYNPFTDPTNTTVFVGGLSSNVTEDDLRTYFGPFGEIQYTKIPPGKGCGFVQFSNRTSAEAAIAQMNGYAIGNSRVRLSWGRANISDKPMPSTGVQQQGWGGAAMAGWNAARPATPYMAVQYGAAAYGGYVAQNAVVPVPAASGPSASSIGGPISGLGSARYEHSPGPSATTPLGSSILPTHIQMEDPLAPVDVNQANESFINGEEAVLSNTELNGDSGSGNTGWMTGTQVFAQ
ncbi:hypothetical protein SeLEV6574_g06236 [Synchytrium endobioticum]|uniref:RRM domain-containing protein n=1 Tax=Synchytrium endobioticum TaxID=286115 RepID=A0A507CPS9_9FUNG|nr:hypothetical protein SeLEV6574_g06236 [Synchytrium endobioticum]